MIKEELEKEADDYADKHAFRVPYDGSNKFYDDVDLKASREGYLAGAESREKRIAELEKENKDLRDNYDQFKAVAVPEIERLQKENAELRNNGFTVSAMTEQQLKVAIEKGEQLEKENAELKHNKKTVAHLADCLEEKMKERIEELKQQIEQMKSDVIECFGSEYNVLVAKLLDKWELKEND